MKLLLFAMFVLALVWVVRKLRTPDPLTDAPLSPPERVTTFDEV